MKVRTAWISSVIFSFVAVLGVGGFSFFLISSKSENTAETSEAETELADNEVFASSILPIPQETPSIESRLTALRDKLTSRMTESKEAVSEPEEDYEIFDTDEISISDIVADEPAPESKSRSRSAERNKPLRTAKLDSRRSADSRLSFRGLKADESELSRRVMPDRSESTNQRSNERSADLAALARMNQEIPAELDPDDHNQSSPDNEKLAKVSSFKSRNNFQSSSRSSSVGKQSFDNLLEQDEDFDHDAGNKHTDISDVDESRRDEVSLNSAGVDVIAIIVNRENNENISIADVKNIYVDKRINWGDGGRIITYNLPVNSSAREIFSQSVLDMSAMQAATEASNRVITNSSYNLSHTKKDRLVISYVSRNPRAIGYVSLKSAKSNSKVRIILTTR